MKISEFRKISAGVKIKVEDKIFDVREVVKFRFDDGTFYIKCFLNDDYVLADDNNSNNYLLVKEEKTNIPMPFPQVLNFKGKIFNFLYTAHAVAEEIEGEPIFKKGESETFWDFQADDETYLSLGIKDQSRERLDFLGKILSLDKISVQ